MGKSGVPGSDSIRIPFKSRPGDIEAAKYLIEINADVKDASTRELVGKLRAFWADIDGACDDGWDVFELLDVRAETHPFSQLFQDGREETLFASTLLILDRLEILPPYRGQGLGLVCLNRVIRRYWNGCGLVALKPFPLQFENPDTEEPWSQQMQLKKFGRNSKRCVSALQNYYGRIGFKKVRGTDLMVLDQILWKEFA